MLFMKSNRPSLFLLFCEKLDDYDAICEPHGLDH